LDWIILAQNKQNSGTLVKRIVKDLICKMQVIS